MRGARGARGRGSPCPERGGSGARGRGADALEAGGGIARRAGPRARRSIAADATAGVEDGRGRRGPRRSGRRGLRAGASSLTTSRTPRLPPRSAVSATTAKTPLDDREASAEVTNGADVSAAAGRAGCGVWSSTAGGVTLDGMRPGWPDIGPRRTVTPAARARPPPAPTPTGNGGRARARGRGRTRVEGGRQARAASRGTEGGSADFDEQVAHALALEGQHAGDALYAMTPSDQRSVRWSMSRRPRACSGDM